jgi:aerotaxis receptor
MAQNSMSEGEYDLSELFYSRTDNSGKIISGNTIFQRVSGYTWDELLNKPHNIVRHKDMPKAVFYLLWEKLKANEPISAYVNNRSKNGIPYFVYAMAFPIPNGYLSIRFKPTTEISKIVEAEYDSLRSKEFAEKLSNEDSLSILSEKLKSLGFDNYESFMTYAFIEELKSRKTKLGLRDGILDSISSQNKCTQAMIQEIKQLYACFAENKLLPLNMMIKSATNIEAKLLGIVAQQYDTIAQEMKTKFEAFFILSEKVIKQLLNCQFLLSASFLQKEMALFFSKETESGAINLEDELKLLNHLADEYSKKVKRTLVEALEVITEFSATFEVLRNLYLALRIVCINGKMETSKLPIEIREPFSVLIENLENFQFQLKLSIVTLNNSCDSIKSISESIYSNSFSEIS